MARQYQMSWEGLPSFRWVKMHKGIRYRVSCQELGSMIFTQEASYKAANEWWEKKVAELAGIPARVDVLVAALTPDRDEQERDRDRSRIIREVVGKIVQAEETKGSRLDQKEMQSVVALMPEVDALLPDEVQVQGKTVADSLDSWLMLKRRNLKPKSIKEVITFVSEWKSIKSAGKTILSGSMPIKCIDEDKLHDVFVALDSRDLGPVAKSKRWIRFREWVEWAATMRHIEVPRNLRSKQYKIELPRRQPAVMTLETARDVLARLPPRLKLYALLGINCSCNNVDVGGLLKSQIDRTTGRISRKRIKTEKQDKVPTVHFRLWPETLDLLRSHLSTSETHPDHALTSSRGTPLYTAVIRDGEPKITDLISQQWVDGKTGITFSQWRDLGSNLIYRDPVHRVLKSLYLGHAPQGVAERHYIDPPPDTLDSALDYMHGLLFPS